ncbi:MAG: DNA phosphorothioation-associated protein 4 [Acaryochloridaceae cyanobacterium RL_2_7]|nr:DNA phosphorothioation-associated protein 4 [Acaryochloridaceae cyanobacterium RL_2_7]
MADIRIKVAKDKAKLVKALRAGDGATGPFQTFYEVIAFAAALGIRKGKFVPFEEKDASREIDPIRQEQFASKGYDRIIDLISLIHERNPKSLTDSTEYEVRRIAMFEAYANGGLEILEDVVRGSGNISNQILLLITSVKIQSPAEDNDLELGFL